MASAQSKAGDSATLIALARYKDFFKDMRYLSVLMATDRREIKRHVQLNQKLAQKQEQVQSTLARLAALEGQLKLETVELERGQNRLSASLEEMERNQKLVNLEMI